MTNPLASTMFALNQPPLPWNQALSGVFGSISLTAWICLLVPQLIKNYRSQSAEALSMAFLFVWLLGDLANLSGALFTDLAPTAVAIGSYFIFADLVLVGQCVYYNTLNASRRHSQHHEQPHSPVDEDAPLLGSRRGSSASSYAGAASGSGMESLGKMLAGDDERDNLSWWQNGMSLLAVYAIGVGAWLISYMVGVWDSGDSGVVGPPASDDAPHVVGMVLGYVSAAFYLCARIPQIIKNYREQSCEGLALLFFMLSLTGNLMYGLSLLSYKLSKEEFIKSLPWLLGSLGTIAQDCIIFIQFQIYSPRREPPASPPAPPPHDEA